MGPLHAAIHEEFFPPCLVVIDALDECKDGNATSVILSSLSIFAGRLSPLRFFDLHHPRRGRDAARDVAARPVQGDGPHNSTAQKAAQTVLVRVPLAL